MKKLRHEQLGESIFTSFRTFDGKVFGFQEHIHRLWSGAQAYYGLTHLSREQFVEYFVEKLNLEGEFQQNPNHYFRLTLYSTGDLNLNKTHFGVSEMNLDMQVRPASSLHNSLRLKTYPSPYSEDFIPIKNGSYFQSLYLRKKARLAGFDDALLTRGEQLLEATTSSIMFVKDNTFVFPQSKGTLAGITEKLLKQYAQANNIEYECREVFKQELASFSRAYLLNSVSMLTSVTQIDEFEFDEDMQLRDSFISYAKESL